MTLIKMPFTKWSKKALIDRGKTCTSRKKRHGKPGDHFFAEGKRYAIKRLIKLPLWFVKEFLYLQEGAESPEEFEKVWRDIHPEKGFEPEEMVWVHFFTNPRTKIKSEKSAKLQAGQDLLELPGNASEIISGWIAKMVKSSGAKGAVLGMSGGLDSSVTTVLCKRALGENVLGLLMPCHSEPQDLRHAGLVARKFGIETRTIDLSDAYDAILKSLPSGDRIARANIKPRLRMLTLYYFANLKKYLVAGTGNMTETLLGYTTKHGDNAADILPLGGLYKTRVIELARRLKIPEEIINRPPSAGLWLNQTDEAELGMSYKELDEILIGMEKNKTRDLDPAKLQKVKEMIKKSGHKREAAPVCKIWTKKK